MLRPPMYRGRGNKNIFGGLSHSKMVALGMDISCLYWSTCSPRWFAWSTIGDRAFPVAAVRLPHHVTSASSLLVLQSRLKTHLFTVSCPSPWPCTVLAQWHFHFGHFNCLCCLLTVLTYLLTYLLTGLWLLATWCCSAFIKSRNSFAVMIAA